ncbi:MAG: hypothetical protein RLZZ63_1006 [Gemmatimonadota bacterium]|jgi:hypothetical protein
MRTSPLIRSALLVAGIAALGACGDATGSSRGTVTILLKDAPGDVRKAVVTIDQIYLQPGSDSGASRVVLRSTPVTGDLLELRNDIAALVEGAIVPPGTYGQLRFVISGGCLAVEDTDGSTKIFSSTSSYAGLALCTANGGTTGGTLQMPSFAQTGIKVTLPDGGVTIGDDAKILLVDFDVSRSFGKEAGNSGRWVMSPSLKASDFNATGSAKVTISATPAAALLLGGMDKLKVTLTGSDGATTTLTGTDLIVNPTTAEVTFRYLRAGTFTLGVTADGKTLTVSGPTSVTVTSGGLATVALEISNVATP